MISRKHGRSRLSEHIADELQAGIVNGGIVPNLRLPTETSLMERYAVSRTVVREAAKVLEQRGLVTIAPGRGMVVAEFDGARIAEQFSLVMLASDGNFGQMLELRLALELHIATAAAARPAETTLARMERSIAMGTTILQDGDPIDAAAFLDTDMTFHEALAAASGNSFFELVCRPINTFLRSHYKHRDGYPSDPARTLEEHQEILDALRLRDTFGARQATEAHLRRLLRKWQTSVGATSAPSIRELNSARSASDGPAAPRPGHDNEVQEEKACQEHPSGD